MLGFSCGLARSGARARKGGTRLLGRFVWRGALLGAVAARLDDDHKSKGVAKNLVERGNCVVRGRLAKADDDLNLPADAAVGAGEAREMLAVKVLLCGGIPAVYAGDVEHDARLGAIEDGEFRDGDVWAVKFHGDALLLRMGGAGDGGTEGEHQKQRGEASKHISP